MSEHTRKNDEEMSKNDLLQQKSIKLRNTYYKHMHSLHTCTLPCVHMTCRVSSSMVVQKHKNTFVWMFYPFVTRLYFPKLFCKSYMYMVSAELLNILFIFTEMLSAHSCFQHGLPKLPTGWCINDWQIINYSWILIFKVFFLFLLQIKQNYEIQG